ncbi:hypothetical protein BJY01DRAFT_246130 [Aspergillus pseudoustus]|uniref:Nucleoside phosphorylase domain-containing protein n=1 Tax=Aspergillus pseudoustus TaxID=1810923 RepID=A0ABR4K9R2_9EURO
MKKLSPDSYTVGWVCALSLELTAAKAMLDETHSNPRQPPSDPNRYTVGEISGHNVVIAPLPAGVYGTTSASFVTASLLSTFPFIRFVLLVGIGGGVPSQRVDIRLGDVVVSKPIGAHGGVIQYDYGKTVRDGHLQRTGSLNKPPPALLTALAELQSRYMAGEGHIADVLDATTHNPKFSLFEQPISQIDLLFEADYDHADEGSSCDKCDKRRLVPRKARISRGPEVHYGLIASGNQVMKHGRTRDRVANETGILCFEMEAAGLMDHVPCLVIRGICDYSDSHKSKEWQGYAALAAAAYTKELLSVAPVVETPNVNSLEQTDNTYIGYMYNLSSRSPLPQPLVPRLELEDIKAHWIPQGGQRNANGLLGRLSHSHPAQAPSVITTSVRSAQANELLQWTLQTPSTLPPLSYATQSLVQAEKTAAQSAQDLDASASLQGLLQPKSFSSTQHTTATQSALPRERPQDRLRRFITSHHTEPSLSQPIQSLIRPETKAQLSRQARDTLHSNFQKVLQETARPFKPEDAANLGVLFLEQGDAVEAERKFREAIRGFENAQIPIDETKAALQTVENLGIAYMYQDKWADAELHLSRALGGLERTLGAGHDSTIRALNNIGLLYLKQGRLTDAERIFERAIRSDVSSAGVGQSTYRTLSNIGILYCTQGRWDEAETMLQSALRGFEDSQKRADVSTLRTLNCLGILYWNQGKRVQAKEMYVRALEGYKKLLGEDHITTLRTVNCLGILSWNQGNRAEAEKLLQQALRGLEKALGLDHTSTLHIINNLGILYWSQGMLAEARKMYERAQRGLTVRLGRSHPSTLCVVNNMANLYMSEDNLFEAEELYQRALTGFGKVFDRCHISTAHVAMNLGNLYLNQGKLKDAEEMCARAETGGDLPTRPMHEMINAAFALIDY